MALVILPPDGSFTFIATVLIGLVLGFLVGVVARAVAMAGVALLAIILILIALGIIEPSQVIQPVLKYIRSGPALVEWVNRIAGYLPYTSLTFIIGFVIGIFKG